MKIRSWPREDGPRQRTRRRARSGRNRFQLEGLEPRQLLASLTAGPTINTSQRVGVQSEEAIAINPTNPDNIVVMANENDQFAGEFIGITFDGGATWSRRSFGDGTDGLPFNGGDPTLAFDNFGNLWTTYIGPNGTTPILLSTNGGVNFRLITSFNDQFDQPKIVTGPGQNPGEESVWCVYTGTNGITAVGTSVTGLNQFGATWVHEVAPGSPGNGFDSFGGIAIGPQGQVVVNYGSITNNTGPTTLFMNIDADGLGPGGFSPARAIVTTNVGWNTPIPAQPRRNIDWSTRVVYDNSGGPFDGRLYMTYVDRTSTSSADTKPYLISSDDDGVTWSSRVRVDDDPVGTNSKFFPYPAVDQSTGAIAISYYDCRDDRGQRDGLGDLNGVPNDETNYFVTASFDGGQTFEPSVKVSNGPSNPRRATGFTLNDYGDYTGCSFVNGLIYPVWCDNSPNLPGNPDGGLEIATNRVTTQPPQPPGVTPAPFDFAAVEGQGLNFVTLAQLTDPSGPHPASAYTVTVDWGDGTGSSPANLVYVNDTTYAIQGSHLYRHAGNYSLTIAASSIVSGLNTQFTKPITVLDLPLRPGPSLDISGLTESTPFAGVVAHFTDDNPSSADSDYLANFPYRATITWGDDNTTSPAQVVANPNGGFDVMPLAMFPHQFQRGGNFNITTTVTDVTSAVVMTNVATVAKATLGVTVNSIGTGTVPFTEGSLFDGTIAEVRGPSNPNRGGDFNITVNWGDGQTTTSPVVTYVGADPNGVGIFQVNATHRYAAAGTFPIQVFVTDYDGTLASPYPATGQAVVAALPVQVNASDFRVADGQTFTRTVASIVDGNISAIPSDYTVVIDWGDGKTSAGAVRYSTTNPGTFDVVGTHNYTYRRIPYTMRVEVFKGGVSRAIGTSKVTVDDAQIVPTGVPIAAVEGTPFTGVVARFTVPSSNVVVAQYSASIDWGDGQVSSGDVGLTSTAGTYEVRGNHLFKFGTFSVTVAISSRNGAAATITTTANVTDAPSFVTGLPVQAVEGVASGSVLVATFLNNDQFADASRFTASIAWGDGQVSTGAVTGSSTAGYSVMGSNLYANPGQFPVTVTITQTTGGVASATGTAFVSVRVEPVKGDLAPGTDTGLLPGSAITNDQTPTIIGTVRANANVQVYAQAPGDPKPTLIATTTADGSGNYTVIPTTPLAAGVYTITVGATNASGQVVGQPTPILGSKPLIIDTAPPAVAGTSLQPSRGQFRAAFSDNWGLDLNSLLSRGNYVVTNAQTGRTVSITSVAFDPSSPQTGTSRSVIVTVNGGRALAAGTYLFNIKSAGTRDSAGNNLVERKFINFPTTALVPPNDYLASFKTNARSATNPQVFVTPVAVDGALAYLLYIRSRPRAARR